MPVSLPPLVRVTVDLTAGEQVIEVGIRDGALIAMVPGSGSLIWLPPECGLRVVVTGTEPRQMLAEIITYRVDET